MTDGKTPPIKWFKWHWQDAITGEDPDWIFYEVDVPQDLVLRIVELYADGTAFRNSIELAEREGLDRRSPEFRTLVHGNFLRGPDQEGWAKDLVSIPDVEFKQIWDRAQDVPLP